ncbi:MAG: DsrE family protein [Candidatus Heimdallarchaeota archaeon]|nr:DsrE family protein [Candidatus Heimdallarchaeota archaeon]
MSNFPIRYFLIFTNSPDEKIHRNSMNAGLRLALTLLMDEYEVHVLLTEEAIFLAKKRNKAEQQTLDKYSNIEENEESIMENDLNFTPYELLDGIISFGGHVMSCKSSLTLTGLKESDIIDSVELIHLQNAVKIMIGCNTTLVF